jgi:hypothetical protein
MTGSLNELNRIGKIYARQQQLLVVITFFIRLSESLRDPAHCTAGHVVVLNDVPTKWMNG